MARAHSHARCFKVPPAKELLALNLFPVERIKAEFPTLTSMVPTDAHAFETRAWTRAWRKERSGDARVELSCCWRWFGCSLLAMERSTWFIIFFRAIAHPKLAVSILAGGGAPVKEEVPVVENAQK